MKEKQRWQQWYINSNTNNNATTDNPTGNNNAIVNQLFTLFKVRTRSSDVERYSIGKMNIVCYYVEYINKNSTYICSLLKLNNSENICILLEK